MSNLLEDAIAVVPDSANLALRRIIFWLEAICEEADIDTEDTFLNISATHKKTGEIHEVDINLANDIAAAKRFLTTTE